MMHQRPILRSPTDQSSRRDETADELQAQILHEIERPRDDDQYVEVDVIDD